MNHAMRIRKFLANTASIVLHFAHGGLVVTGLLVAVLIASRVGAGGMQHTQTEMKNWVSTFWSMGAQGGGFSLTSADISAAPVLTPDMRRVADYLSHKYRVAAPAVEPLVAAAHVVGSRVGLDPMLILAVAAIESGFNPFAESTMGARGLMQVIPKYHQDKLAQQDQENPLLDPVTNIEVGAQVLKESIQRAGNLKAGLQQYGGATDGEGNQYVSRVLAIKQQLDQARRQPRQAGA
ncbi:MAG: transglycosylase SLT domain-containing protein [Rhodocyclaceae bacterium]|nr:transglycosylase SLT domain-containing protein [Rhodocyclaceae bacterium]